MIALILMFALYDITQWQGFLDLVGVAVLLELIIRGLLAKDEEVDANRTS